MTRQFASQALLFSSLSSGAFIWNSKRTAMSRGLSSWVVPDKRRRAVPFQSPSRLSRETGSIDVSFGNGVLESTRRD